MTTDFAQEADMDRILEINRLEYGPQDILSTRKDFDWRYGQNPSGKAIIPVIRDHMNRVIGFIWIVPLRIRVKGKDYLAAMGSNLVIHPDYRNAIGYTKLMRCFQSTITKNDIPIHYSFISEDAYQRQIIQNPQSVATIPVLAKLFDSKALINSYVQGHYKKGILNLASLIAAPILFSAKRTSVGDSISIKNCDDFNCNFDAFWQNVRDDYPASVIRDRSFLSWRFAPISNRRYNIFAAVHQEKILAYIVLRCATLRGIRVGIISDFVVARARLSRDAGLILLNKAESWFREDNMSLSVALVSSNSETYKMLRRAGYIRVPQFLSPKVFRFSVFIHMKNVKAMSSLSAREWFVTAADYESF